LENGIEIPILTDGDKSAAKNCAQILYDFHSPNSSLIPENDKTAAKPLTLTASSCIFTRLAANHLLLIRITLSDPPGQRRLATQFSRSPSRSFKGR
jgi:hypothetical protein